MLVASDQNLNRILSHLGTLLSDDKQHNLQQKNALKYSNRIARIIPPGEVPGLETSTLLEDTSYSFEIIIFKLDSRVAR